MPIISLSRWNMTSSVSVCRLSRSCFVRLQPVNQQQHSEHLPDLLVRLSQRRRVAWVCWPRKANGAEPWAPSFSLYLMAMQRYETWRSHREWKSSISSGVRAWLSLTRASGNSISQSHYVEGKHRPITNNLSLLLFSYYIKPFFDRWGSVFHTEAVSFNIWNENLLLWCNYTNRCFKNWTLNWNGFIYNGIYLVNT